MFAAADILSLETRFDTSPHLRPGNNHCHGVTRGVTGRVMEIPTITKYGQQIDKQWLPGCPPLSV
jgi:hypothetical protein